MNELTVAVLIGVGIGFGLCVVLNPSLYKLISVYRAKSYVDDQMEKEAEQFIEHLFAMLESSAHMEKLTFELIENSHDINTLKADFEPFKRDPFEGIREVKHSYYEGV